MKIGVAIPCRKKDILFLNRCLRSIENQTRKPDLVSISISECDENDIKNIHTILQIQISFSINKQNAALNRNIAGNLLGEMDIISFMDADDEMYPWKLEYLEKAFLENNIDFVLHSYSIIRSYNESLLCRNIKFKYDFYPNSIVPNPKHCGVMVNPSSISNKNAMICHGHVTVRKSIFQNEKIKIEDRFVGWEDSEYCRRLIDKNFKGGYLYLELSKYHYYNESSVELEIIKNVERIHNKKFCVITTCIDLNSLDKAKITINDIRTRGNFKGDIVLLTHNSFKIEDKFISSMKIKIIEKSDKLYAFDIYFKQYDYVMFIDAGIRIFDDIQNFYNLFVDNSLVAPADENYNNKSKFLNCIFLYDTKIIQNNTVSNLIKLHSTNKTDAMNEYFHNVWKPMNVKVGNKILFEKTQ